MYTAVQFLFPIYPTAPVTGENAVLRSDDYFRYLIDNEQVETSDGIREVPVTLWHPEEVGDMNGKLILFSHWSVGIADGKDE